LRRRIIHPHPNPLINGKEAITLTSILSPQGRGRSRGTKGFHREKEIRGRDLSEAPPVKT
jgi:hypothetical protein